MLITTCDSFRPSDAGDEVELSILDTNPAVLLGVNERVPRFSDFIASPMKHPDQVEMELYTHSLYRGLNPPLMTFTPWSLADDAAMLSRCSGSLALRIRLKAAWPEAARVQERHLLNANEYGSWLESSSSAVAKLAPLLPSKYVDLAFPGLTGSKFELLNGWRLQAGSARANRVSSRTLVLQTNAPQRHARLRIGSTCRRQVECERRVVDPQRQRA
jgi:hypothetical protein